MDRPLSLVLGGKRIGHLIRQKQKTSKEMSLMVVDRMVCVVNHGPSNLSKENIQSVSIGTVVRHNVQVGGGPGGRLGSTSPSPPSFSSQLGNVSNIGHGRRESMLRASRQVTTRNRRAGLATASGWVSVWQ